MTKTHLLHKDNETSFRRFITLVWTMVVSGLYIGASISGTPVPVGTNVLTAIVWLSYFLNGSQYNGVVMAFINRWGGNTAKQPKPE
jgi:hypothetical protein